MQFDEIADLSEALRIASKLAKKVDEERIFITDSYSKVVE